MYISREATAALNEYLDEVNRALPLRPSQRMAAVDDLYEEILEACERAARDRQLAEINLDVVSSRLVLMGAPQDQALRLGARHGRSAAGAFGFDVSRFNDRAASFAKAAAQRGESAFHLSIETAAHALDFAARRLQQAADKFRART